MESSQNTQAGQAASPSQPKVGPVLGTVSGSNNAGPNQARSIARTALATICNEAEFLQRMCDGQAHNIATLSEELESLRRMNDRQADTIADTVFPASLYAELGVSSNNGLRNRIRELLKLQERNDRQAETIKRLQAEVNALEKQAAFGRKMAASAGVNIA